MGRKDTNPAWREANIWEKPEPARRYSTWGTTTTNTWASDEVDPEFEAQIQTEEEKTKKKPSVWRSLACGMKVSIYGTPLHHPALACDMFKPAFPWIAHLHCPFLCISASPPPLRNEEPAEKGGPSTPPMFRLSTGP